MADLKWLENWFVINSQKLDSKEIHFSFSEITKTNNPALVVDIDTKTRMGRVTLWETGECDFEIVENETAKQVVFVNRIIKAEKQLSSFLTNTFSSYLNF